MNYLKNEFERYKAGKDQGKGFQEIFVLKAHAIREIFDQADSRLNPKSILEVGFGSGYMLSLFSKKGVNSTGIDFSDIAIEYGDMLLKDEGNDAMITRADAFRLPFRDNSFDLVYNIGVIEHYPSEEQLEMVNEMRRVSRKNILVGIPNNREGTLYRNFINHGKRYIVEDEKSVDYGELAGIVGMEKNWEGGSHIIATERTIFPELLAMYELRGIDLPREKYFSSELDKLKEYEGKFTDKEKSEIGFLRYVVFNKC